MGQISLQIPQVGNLNSTEDPKVASDLTTIQNLVNGNLDATNISQTLAQSAVVNVSGQVVKGATNIAGPESRTNTAFGTMPTPDQVQNVVLPSNGLIVVAFQATWQQSTNGAQAAIFVGSNQVQAAGLGITGGPLAQSAQLGNIASSNFSLSSWSGGLITSTANPYTSDVTTGQVVGELTGAAAGVGGPCYIFAAAGTYTVSIQYKIASGSVTASNRKLWVYTLSFT